MNNQKKTDNFVSINLCNNQKPMRNGFMTYGYHHEPQFYQLCLPG